MLWYTACTAIKPFQGLTQLSVETHLNTDKAKLTSFKQQTNNQKKQTKKQGRKVGGRAEDWGEGINCNLEHHRDSAIFILDYIYRFGKRT